jgi:signal transduction histidine kinase/ActR/RegA family two-component response regulator
MKDKGKAKEQLIEELQGLRKRNAELEVLVTKHKETENLLQVERDRFKTILETNPCGIYIVDQQHNIEYINPVIKKEFGPVDDRKCYEYFHDRTELCPWCKNDEVFAGKSVWWEWYSKKNNRYYDLFDTPIKNSDGSISKFEIFYDITERKQLEDNLQQSQKMEAVGTLSGGIAHNFNNILGSIMGYTELVIDEIPENLQEDSLIRQNLNEVMKASRRASDLVRQILSFSRKSVGDKRPLNMNLVLNDAMKMLRSTIRTAIDIRQNISCPLDTVTGNKVEINQVIINLCINAEQAMLETGGVIEVSLENIDLKPEEVTKYRDDIQPGTYVQLTVSDTGPGIDRKIIDKVFEPFFTTKDVGKGTGMGLSAVHGIVTNYNGTITVESEPGKGTTFKVLFPVSQEKVETEVKAEEPLPTGTEHILFVDDEESFADMGKQLMERLGYKVTVKLNGNEALEAFRSKPDKFDLVIADYDMPKMTGDVLTKELLNIREDIPVIISTGYGHLITDGEIETKGVKVFIMKPFDMRQIAKTIRDVLDGK